MQDAYLFAMGLRPPVILGRQLRPFCAAHLMELECADSSLVYDASQITPADLLLAVFICFHAWPFPWQEIAEDTLTENVKAWGELVGPEWDFPGALAQWLDYYRVYMAGPERSHKPDAGGAIRAPVPVKIVSWLLRTIHGMTETRAWNMPICLALAYKAGCDALNDDKSLLDEDAIAVLDADEPAAELQKES